MTQLKEFENKTVRFHEDRVGRYFATLCEAQLDLIRAYEKHWAELNYLVRTGQWDNKTEYPGNAYGLKADIEVYVFQLDMPIPFIPNPYTRRFTESAKDYFTAKWLVSAQFRDVMEQLNVERIYGPAALYIKHYYSNDRLFDHDHKIKEVIINTLKEGNLLRDDDVRSLAYYSEEAQPCNENKTMIYIGPYSRRPYLEEEVIPKYPEINRLMNAVAGKLPRTIIANNPSPVDTKRKPKQSTATHRKEKTPKKTEDEMERLRKLNQNFM